MEENKVEDKTEKTFKERYLAGEIEFEEDVWIDESDEALQEMLDKQKA